MNLDTLVKRGYRPWTPAPGVYGVDIWHEYDIPTVGTFRTVEGHSVLFTLVGEPDDRLTVWAYTCINPQDAERMANESFTSPAELDEFVNNEFAHRKAVFALADNLEIQRWTPLEVEIGVLESATEFLRAIRASLASKSPPSTRFRAELAGVDVETTTELVDA